MEWRKILRQLLSGEASPFKDRESNQFLKKSGWLHHCSCSVKFSKNLAPDNAITARLKSKYVIQGFTFDSLLNLICFSKIKPTHEITSVIESPNLRYIHRQTES